MIARKHRKPVRKEDKPRAATLPTTGKKPLGQVKKADKTAMVAAANPDLSVSTMFRLVYVKRGYSEQALQRLINTA